jgi:hypothetical protein
MFTIDNDTNKMTIIRKDTASFNIALENYELGNGDTVTFTIAREKEQECPLVQIIVTEFLNGVATVFLESANTDLDEGTYLYDVQINTADGRVDTVVGPAKFKVIGGVTY